MTATVYRCQCGQFVADHPVCVDCAEQRLGELVESVSERGCPGSGVGGDCATVIEGRSDTLPCPVCPGTTERAGELCDDCAAYVGAAPEVGR